MRPVTIEVKQEHIDKGQPNPDYCPIALAAQDAGLIDPCVYANDIQFLDHNEDYHSAALTAEAMAFVVAFDARRPVQPFEFTIWV